MMGTTECLGLYNTHDTVSELLQVERERNFQDTNSLNSLREDCAVSLIRPAYLSPWIWLIKLKMPFDH